MAAINSTVPNSLTAAPLPPKKRNSGVELLKIISIFLILISHVVQTLTTDFGPSVDTGGFFINISNASTDPVTLILTVLRYFGQFGNNIFFICSAWYLTESKKTNYKKLLNMMGDVLMISLLWLVPMFLAFGRGLGLRAIISSFLPTYFGNNWYVSLYIVFAFIYPAINLYLNHIPQKQHLMISLLALVVVVIGGMISVFYGASNLLIWVSVYSLILYIKKYHVDVTNNKKVNLLILAVGVLGFICCIAALEILGAGFSFINGKMLRFNSPHNIFLWMIAYALLNLFRQMTFKSGFVNGCSALTLFVYVIHENTLFRSTLRPIIWNEIVTAFPTSPVLLWTLIFALGLFLASFVAAWLYSISLKKIVKRITDKLYRVVIGFADRILPEASE